MTPSDLCREHGYPNELEKALTGLVEVARECFPGLLSVVLSGSVATGDFLTRPRSGGSELLSDVDGFVYASAPAAGTKRFYSSLARLETAAS